MNESMDLKIMKLDADIYSGLNDFKAVLEEYINSYLLISVEPNNQDRVQAFYEGFYKLSLGIAGLVEAYRQLCYCKDVVVTS
jgi:hypothetical protein